MASLRVGFVGVGFMGKGMVKNLLQKGVKSVSIFEQNSANIDRLLSSVSSEARGNLKITSSPLEVAKLSDVVGLSLPSEAAAESVIFGKNGLLEGFATSDDKSGGAAPIIMEHGTVSRHFVLSAAKRANEAGVVYLDAPVSGGPAGSESGTLSIMLGGDPASASRVKSVLRKYASNILHFGGVGSGMGAKLVNQALVGMHAQAACEALLLAEKMGLTKGADDTQRLLDLLKTSWGQSKALELVFTDYIATQHNGWETVMTSGAPLRNFYKDFSSIEAELPTKKPRDRTTTNHFSASPLDSEGRFPALELTHEAINDACEQGYKDGSLLNLIRLLAKRG